MTWKDILAAPAGDDEVRKALHAALVAESNEMLTREPPARIRGEIALSDHAMEQMVSRNIRLDQVLMALGGSKTRSLRQGPLCMHAHGSVRVVVRKRGLGEILVVSAYHRSRPKSKRQRSRHAPKRDDGNRRRNEKLRRKNRRMGGR